jgi:hypothetical protein
MDHYAAVQKACVAYNKKHAPVMPPRPMRPQTQREAQNASCVAALGLMPSATVFKFDFGDTLLDKDVNASILEALREKVLDIPAEPSCFECRYIVDGRVEYSTTFVDKTADGIYTLIPFASLAGRSPAEPMVPVVFLAYEGKFQYQHLPFYKDWEKGCYTQASVVFHFFIQALATLETRGAVVTEVQALRAERRRREREGEMSLPPYHVVTIPKARQLASDAQGGTHASPRLHLRRGHVRRYQSGEKLWIKPFMVGDATRGVVTKHYIVE